MTPSRAAASIAVQAASRVCLSAAFYLAAAAFAHAQAQQQQSAHEARIVVVGEGSVGAAPDYAQIRAGATVRARTAKEAVDASSKLMAAITTALLNASIEQKDIQTSRFSVQPVYESPVSGNPPRFAGFSASNQVSVTIRQIGTVGDILDRVLSAGATDVNSVEFLHSEPSKLLDRARAAAVADARRKAELYAQASGVSLGSVVWITEGSGYGAPTFGGAPRMAIAPSPVPISAGEDTMAVRITVGFDIAK